MAIQARRWRRWSGSRIALAIATLALIAVAGLAVHLAADASYRRSFVSTTSLEVRKSSAVLGARLEPWNRRFSAREFVMVEWAKGQKLLESGNYNAAVDVLFEAYRRDVGDADLLALFKKAQAVQAEATNRKAHLQHGHEGPGGTLRPEDIER